MNHRNWNDDGHIGEHMRSAATPVVRPDFADNVMEDVRRLATAPRPRPAVHRRRWAPLALAATLTAVTIGVILRAGGGEAVPVRRAAPAMVRRVNFAVRLPHAHSVGVIGSFDGWQHAVPLKRHAHGLWVARLRLPVGQYAYLFVVNGHRTMPNPQSREQQPDGFGGENSVIIVDGRATA
ncbi:MAG: glycogen-binding domain-containing protein [Gammaproteobacteria bacterium]|nr:glycogen-binding domain-containing protein [Gammaproteobacteria bacterium]